MGRAVTFRRQQFLLLAISLSILAVAILLLVQREQVQRELSTLIDNHRLVVYHVDKAREELRRIGQQIIMRRLQLPGAVNDGKAQRIGSFDDTISNSVSIHVLEEHVRDMRLHQSSIAADDPLLQKFERQMTTLLTAGDRLDLASKLDLDRLERQVEGLILSTEQIEAVRGLDIRRLTDRQSRIANRDTITLILMTTTLVLFSYLSIAWIMGRIRAMMEEQDELAQMLERKNAELERFTYTVSHDLKSPLVTIKNFIGIMERDLREGDRCKVYEDIKRVSSAADDMAELLEGLLELGRIGHVVNPPQAGNLNDLVERAVDKLRPLIEASGIELRVEPDMPGYWGDSLRLQEVFQNLIENSVKFMGDQASPLIRIDAREEQGQLICSVGDNGIGIERKYADRIFNLFERLDQTIEGTGIGLALVQRIVEAHGGRIWVDLDIPGPGCRIVFSLPSGPDSELPAA